MGLLKAALLGAVAAVALPMVFGGRSGAWMSSFAEWGTITPHAGSPGLLFSIPVFAGVTIFSWLFFGWSNR
jgi:hypothetical protein